MPPTRVTTSGLLALLSACAGSGPPSAPGSAQVPGPCPVAEPVSPAAPSLAPDCPRGPEDPASRLDEGLALIEEATQGEHAWGPGYMWGMQALREAADAGYPPALLAWGRRRFSAMYQEVGPDPERNAERQAYVQAIAAIASAARLGEADAEGFFPPEIMAGLLDPNRPFPELTGEDRPLADIPRSWWEQARQVVDHHRKCWSAP